MRTASSLRRRLLALVSALALLCALLPAGAETAQTRTQTLYTMNPYSHENKSSISKGNRHDCQHLGIWLPAGTEFKIRQTNTALGADLQLRLRNDDWQHESSPSIPKDGSWLTVTVEYDSVPFITSDYYANGETPQVEFTLSGTRELPIYNYGDDESAFFAKWDALDAAFAVYLSQYTIWLVPERDKQSNQMGSLDDLLLWYDDMVAQYNAFSGLSLDAEESWNRDSGSKYFIRANRNGVGAAYYATNETAPNSESLASYMIRTNWGPLHEVGHGYDTVNFNSAEIWNNVLSHYYQVYHLGEGTWLHLDNGWRNVFESDRADVGGYLKSERFDTRLYFWVNMLDKLGPQETSSAAYRLYRANQAAGTDNLSGYDFYVDAYTRSSGFNVTPWFELWQIPVSEDVKTQLLREERFQNIYPLYNLLKKVTPDEPLTGTRPTDPTVTKHEPLAKALGLSSVYDMVETRQLVEYMASFSPLTGSLTLKLDDLAYSVMTGDTIRITDGRDLVQELSVTSSTLTTQLPIGVYNLYLPASSDPDVLLTPQMGYVVITEDGDLTYSVTAQRATTSYDFVDWTFTFGSNFSYWGNYCTATTDLERGTLHISTVACSPHTYFGTGAFSSITVKNTAGQTVYEKIHTGENTTAEEKTLSIAPGYTLELFHAETVRGHTVSSSALSSVKLVSGAEATGSSKTVFRVTELGLELVSSEGNAVQTTSDVSAEEHYISVLSAELDRLKSLYPTADFRDKTKFPAEKTRFRAAVKRLSPETQARLETEWAGYYPFDTGVQSLTVEAIPTQEHTGSALTPSLTVKAGDATLSAGEYTCLWEDNVKVGTARVKVYGTGAYEGYVGTGEFTISLPQSLPTSFTVQSAVAQYDYSGGDKYPDATVTLGSRTLTRNVDYVLYYSDNVNVGTATITAVGIGNYAGLQGTGAFSIQSKPVTMTATLSHTSFVHNGSPWTPSVTVRALNQTLTQDEDYTVTYSGNIDVGTATVTITGIGNFAGSSTSATFAILAPTTPKALSCSALAGWEMRAYGWSSYGIPYVYLRFDPETASLTVTQRGGSPHYGIGDTLYSSIRVYDERGACVYSFDRLASTDCSSRPADSIPLGEGYVLETYFLEPQRDSSGIYSLSEESICLTLPKTARYEVTSRGLKQLSATEAGDTDPFAAFPTVLNSYMKSLQAQHPKSDFSNAEKMTEEKALVRTAVGLLSTAEATAFQTAFKGYYPFDVPTSNGSGSSSSGGSSSSSSSKPKPSPSPSPSPDPTPEPSPEATSQPSQTVDFTSFSDVKELDYYYKPVQWALENGITNGYEGDTFAPEESCTRAQFVTFLWRAAGCPKSSLKSTKFDDLDGFSYYFQAVLWAVEQGITKGITAEHFGSDEPITRAQAVTMLHRWKDGNPSATIGLGLFDDVSSGDYYAAAVTWASKNGVTNGTTESTFSPHDTCTRAQTVTLLFRAETGEL